MFYVDYWQQQGSDIRATLEGIKKLENYLQKNQYYRPRGSTLLIVPI